MADTNWLDVERDVDEEGAETAMRLEAPVRTSGDAEWDLIHAHVTRPDDRKLFDMVVVCVMGCEPQTIAMDGMDYGEYCRNRPVLETDDTEDESEDTEKTPQKDDTMDVQTYLARCAADMPVVVATLPRISEADWLTQYDPHNGGTDPLVIAAQDPQRVWSVRCVAGEWLCVPGHHPASLGWYITGPRWEPSTLAVVVLEPPRPEFVTAAMLWSPAYGAAALLWNAMQTREDEDDDA